MSGYIRVFGLMAAMLALPALAQDATGAEGYYSSDGKDDGQIHSARLTPVEGDDYAIEIGVVVPLEDQPDGTILPGCGGGIDGRVTIKDGAGTLAAPNEFFDATLPEDGRNRRECKVSMRFSDPDTLEMQELEGCLNFHGAACGFTGILKRDPTGGAQTEAAQ